MSELGRRRLLASLACLLPGLRAGHAAAAEALTIGAKRGSIDFAIGDSRIFRTTGSFTDWYGTVLVDDNDVSRSTVSVKVNTDSIVMLDTQQTNMLKDADFFDVARFPEMTYLSKRIERTGETTLKVDGEITLRGITRPMALDVMVTDRRPDAAPGTRYARFRASGSLKRSEFGMAKFVEIVGDMVDFSIRTDAWR